MLAGGAGLGVLADEPCALFAAAAVDIQRYQIFYDIAFHNYLPHLFR